MNILGHIQRKWIGEYELIKGSLIDFFFTVYKTSTEKPEICFLVEPDFVADKYFTDTLPTN